MSAPDLNALLAQRVDESKAVVREIQEAQAFIAQKRQELFRLEGAANQLSLLGATHPEVIPPPPTDSGQPDAGSAAEPDTEPAPDA